MAELQSVISEFFPYTEVGKAIAKDGEIYFLRGVDCLCDPFGIWALKRPGASTGERIPLEVVFTGAMQFCPDAALQGLCIGVDPDALKKWLWE